MNKNELFNHLGDLVRTADNHIVHIETINKLIITANYLRHEPLKCLVCGDLNLESEVNCAATPIIEYLKDNTKFENAEQYLDFSSSCRELSVILNRYLVKVSLNNKVMLNNIKATVYLLLRNKHDIIKTCDKLSGLTKLGDDIDFYMRNGALDLTSGLCKFFDKRFKSSQDDVFRDLADTLFSQFCEANNLSPNYPVSACGDAPEKQYHGSVLKWGSDPYGAARWKMVENFYNFIFNKFQQIEAQK
ncbi:hypothetical protein Kuja_1270 [Vibrio phage vB_VchM_Kuja]|uniref:Uncharacterized protein n=1 Tax=Vibrio phage vB_VchM_Kuja TaxID=2686437 RepID=A0A6B9J5S3_9CAUD|nr:hypothetical protein HWC83_gp109 [Vibrio phage vB_VchM_Kuja]QGZ16118.1 hypothetical protein Kuja_1270 [Vibrio phage vB_VchM_Kuja]